MVESGPRIRIGENFIHLLVLLIRTHWAIIDLRLAVVLRYRVSSLRIVDLSQPYLILLIIFMGSFTVDIVIRKGIGFIIMVSWVKCREIVLQLGFPLGLTKFWLPYFSLYSKGCEFLYRHSLELSLFSCYSSRLCKLYVIALFL